jgi:glycine dehydrogenase subunit 1
MPYVPHTDKDFKAMLKAIGVRSLKELYSQIPESIMLDEPPDIGRGLSELEVSTLVQDIARRNRSLREFNSFLGAGCYDHYVPAPVSFILSRSQFLTAYTPYQAECSQGALQAIYEYQTFIGLLTGMDITNASMLDGASSLAEAVLMSLRITRRKKIVVARSLNPEYLEVLKTYLSGFDFSIREIGFSGDGLIDLTKLEQLIDEDTSCCVIASPNFFGLIEDLGKITSVLKQKQVLSIMVTNPLSLAVLKEPSSLGLDIVCGDGQSLGQGLCFGGPSFGFLATGKEYMRQLPGRIIGKTVDKKGRTAYCLTLQTREQHIRREKATSNICSNQSLNAIGAAVYLSLMGKEGLRKAALGCLENTRYLYQRLKEVRGVVIPYPPRIFNEFLWEVGGPRKIMEILYKKDIIAGYYVGDRFKEHPNGIISSCTEKKTRADIDNFVNTLAEVLHGEKAYI